MTLLRGNSIATKAMEAYIKMIGEKYLEGTLAPTLHHILDSNLNLEVDPVKVNNTEDLQQHRRDLREVVSTVWKRIANSHSLFPIPLQRCFHKIRQYLEQVWNGYLLFLKIKRNVINYANRLTVAI